MAQLGVDLDARTTEKHELTRTGVNSNAASSQEQRQRLTHKKS
jgi:hypothetical protein